MLKFRGKAKINGWAILSSIFVAMILLPNTNILINLFNETNENWEHIKQYLLRDYITNTSILVFFTGIITILVGTSLAWLVTVYDFPLKRFLKWGLILPLAIPPYIAAYTYNGLLNYTGVIQTFLRNTFELQVNQKYFNVMSIEGAIFIFTITLYPYVYTITRAFLEKQSASLIENARVLGRNSSYIFIKVVLPISRGAIVGGGSLVILEVLNDYGVVKYFGVPTFSTAIFNTWFAMGDIDAAIKLAAMLMAIVFSVLFLEKLGRGKKQFSYTTTKVTPIRPKKLVGLKGIFASSYSLAIFSIGFIIPTLQLIEWTLMTYRNILDIEFVELIFNSIAIAGVSSILIIIIALIIANYTRLTEGLIAKLYSKATVVGYSIPGSVIAIGVISFFIGLDHQLYGVYKILNPETRKLVLSTSIVMLIIAYIIRFIAISFNSIEAGFDKIGKKFTEASRTLGMSVTQTFFKVDMKMIKPAIISGFILIFVDILKELPLTLILRPFNFDTLATKAFEYANDEMVQEAAISSLIIIIISAISIYFFHRVLDKDKEGGE